MSSLFDSLSAELFEVLKGSGKTLTLYGADGNKTYEPKDARRVFATPDNIMVSITEAGSDSEVKLYLSQSTDVRAMSKLINTLRQITTRYNVLFNVRKYGRELAPKDFAYQATNEAAMYGTAKTSYQKFGPTKLMIRHLTPVREGVIGARGRNILSMFVETKDGERFKFQENHLSAGRAFAQHINQGGKPHDEIGTQLVTLATESLQLARVNRYIHHSRNTLGEDAVAWRVPIKSRIVEIRKALSSLARPRGYHKVTEAGLPLASMNLTESDDFGNKLNELSTLLQIDSNHALAESLMPVALLTLGENMTDINEMFHGVITLEDAAADALVEALLDEYGYDSENWTRMGSNIAFNEGAVFEDATGYLDLVESPYQINESDAVLDYATQWTNARFRASGEEGGMDKDQTAGVNELAQGIRGILGGQIETPEFPRTAPQFGRDPTAKARFYLDLYVSQGVLNVATSNYVSSIIDKMAENKKLDGAEKTIAGKLVQTLEDDLNGGEVDESYYDDDPSQGNEAQVEKSVEYYADTFDAESFLATQGYEDFIDPTMSPEDKTDPMDASYFVKGIAHDIGVALENDDIVGVPTDNGFVYNVAQDLFDKKVKPLLIQHGWNLSEAVNEFAATEDKPEHHGIAAGDTVATDMGPGRVISVEGDIAHVEFLHGGTKSMHIDDMDKVPELGGVAEERDLAEWFNSFDPEAVLEVEEPAAPAAPMAKNAPIAAGDRVTHKVYGAGEVVGQNGKFVQVTFDSPHARLPTSKTVSVAPGVLAKAGNRIGQDQHVEEQNLDELSQDKMGDYFNRSAQARGRAEKKGDDGQVDRRDRGLSMAFKKMRNEAFASGTRSALEEGLMGPQHLDAIMSKFKEFADKVFADPETFGVELPVGTDDVSEQEMNANSQIANILATWIAGEIRDIGTDATYESEEVLGGDKGENLIDQTKAPEEEHQGMDEEAQREFETLMKNANFRR